MSKQPTLRMTWSVSGISVFGTCSDCEVRFDASLEGGLPAPLIEKWLEERFELHLKAKHGHDEVNDLRRAG
jgi:hypothetical protein